MLREVVNLVNEAVDEGHERGIALFMENLEEDLAKDHIFESNGGADGVMAQLFEEAGVEIATDDLENLDETKIDEMLNELGDDK